MDQIDRKILDILQQDASIRNVDLADRVGLAPSSCLRRVRILWQSGIITRSVILTDAEKMGRHVKAIVSVKLVDHGNDAREDWLESLTKERAVSQVYSVSGEMDAVVILTLANMKEFQELSQSLFASNSNVFQFVTQFVLEELKFDMSH
ncbi:MAG: Lrp/AsnC family transcriptional regulator [Alphaproteobacteria bacterium]|nr:Lrp/AsnC family transcriptional regulator [Alphaproteobacteria bacterium]